MKEDYYMMWLARMDGLKKQTIEILLNHFENPREIWYANENSLKKINGIGPVLAAKISSSKNKQQLEEWINELEEKEIQYISRLHSQYPYLLKQIYNPPLGLYIKGCLPDEDIDKISIVGARKCSEYGKKCAYNFAKELGKCNIVIVSGLARGIDSAAHKGALASSAHTIAVLGCGLDVCFPAENKRLMDEISKKGCLISEYPLGMPPLAGNFPQRNRIIAGLSKIAIVIEAGERSGSLITADLAMDEGRDVFAVPGEITSSFSDGTNELIKNGAKILTNVEDILFELGIRFEKAELEEYKSKKRQPLAQDEKRVYDCIDFKQVSFEQILNNSGLSVQDLQYILMILELNGFIKKLPAEQYVRLSI